ncbi:hypothetical protein CEXT_686261 [Caerostris extrusa]|uniref:Uncharacterized protein n=1 Tax=Caerostris extrusa TaxID=172846 RepID=A0AAV4Y3X8_CAEEX|nr:hypothetical protein CEXT_686261 [Caerostris extrusa]
MEPERNKCRYVWIKAFFPDWFPVSFRLCCHLFCFLSTSSPVRIDPVPPALTSRLVPPGSSDLHSKPKFIRFGHFQSIFLLSSV